MWPAPKKVSQLLLVTMKGDVVVMLLKRIGCLPEVFVAVTVCEGLVVPTVTLPKARLVGLTLKPLPSASARLAFARPIAKRRVKVKTENAKKDDFGRAMINSSRESDSVTNVCVRAHPHTLSPPPNKSRPKRTRPE
jgi:hypothetical protein